MKDISSIRREYGSHSFSETDIVKDPFQQFEHWFNDALAANLIDANTMVLSTVDSQGYPDSRMVLLKELMPQGFVFFTHYDSPKGQQLENVNIAALNFYWRELARQVRVRGKVEHIPRSESEKYFASRPRASQLSALASKQSEILHDRAELEKRVAELTKQYADKSVPCPENWGGYCVMPFEFEFFQGRDNRLNDRIRYSLVQDKWQIVRLSP